VVILQFQLRRANKPSPLSQKQERKREGLGWPACVRAEKRKLRARTSAEGGVEKKGGAWR